MAYSLVAAKAAICASYGAGVTVTTTAINTTGANLIIAYTTSDGTGASAMSDSKSNTWTKLTEHNAGNPSHCALWYCVSPSVGSGHTFTNNNGFGPSICVAAFSGAQASSTYTSDTGAGAAGSTPSIQPGSISAASAGDLIVTGEGNFAFGFTASINSSFLIADQVGAVSGVGYGNGIAYLIAPNTTAVNPTWTLGGASASGMGSSIATFKAAAGVSSALLMQSSLNGLGASGPFFSNPLG